jgi:hypothetical protein
LLVYELAMPRTLTMWSGIQKLKVCQAGSVRNRAAAMPQNLPMPRTRFIDGFGSRTGSWPDKM